MTKTKSTKRALLTSALALIMCISMLVGSTFAWFTDSVTSGSNKIVAGNLDMKVSYKPYGAQNTEWTEVDEDTVIFGKDALYEPGYTEAVWLKVENLGSLAFRYDLAINVENEKQGTNKAGEKFSLSDYLEVKYMTTTSTDMESIFYTTRESLDNFAWGSPNNSGVTTLKDKIAVIKNGAVFSASDATNGDYSSAYVLVVISMPTTVGNEANHNGTDIPEINFSLTALATQLAYENDSFGSDYDAGATYPVATAAELEEALDTAKDGDTIVLAAGTFELPATIDKALNIVGAPEGTTVSTTMPSGGSLDNHTAAIKVTADNVTMKNLVFDAANGAQGAMVYSQAENLTVENCTFDMRGTNNAGITLWNSDSATIRNCEFINGMKSIYVNGKDADTDTDTDTLLIENCSFEGVYALHVGGAVNIVANNCDFNGVAITLWNGTAVFTDCDFNDGSYNQLLNYYSPATFENCFFGSEFVYALRQAKTEVNVTVNGATYETDGSSFASQCGWSIVTKGDLTSFNVVEDGVTTVIPTTQKV